MLKAEAHGNKLNEFYYLTKKEAKFFIKQKIDGESIIKISVFYFELWCVFELKVPELWQTILNL